MSLLSLLNLSGLKAVKPKKRRGRGQSSGLGKTCGRGHKGQLSRAGARGINMLEGGQTPIYRRLPKRGFNSYNQQFGIETIGLTLYKVAEFVASGKLGKTIKREDLVACGIISNPKQSVKLIGSGECISGVSIEVDNASQSVIEAAAKNNMKVVILGEKSENK